MSRRFASCAVLDRPMAMATARRAVSSSSSPSTARPASRPVGLEQDRDEPRARARRNDHHRRAQGAGRRDRHGLATVNQSQIIASFVRAATWQLMRRSPTWLLLAIVAAAWFMAGHR